MRWQKLILSTWSTLLISPIVFLFWSFAEETCRGSCAPAARIPGRGVSIAVCLMVVAFQAALLMVVWAPSVAKSLRPFWLKVVVSLWTSLLALPFLAVLAAATLADCGEYDQGCSTGDLYFTAPLFAGVFALVAVMQAGFLLSVWKTVQRQGV
jgi:hypothetical protein